MISLATARRRRTSRHRSFIATHGVTILVTVIAVSLIFLIVVVKPFDRLFITNSQNQSAITGTTGIVTLDNSQIGVFDTQSEAEANKTQVTAGIKSLTVSSSENVNVSASMNGIPYRITSTSKNNYTLDLSNVGDGSTIVIRVAIGGDGTFIGQRLDGRIKTRYVAFCVSNPKLTQNQAAQDMGIPTGKIYFGEDSYLTYGSESEALSATYGKRNHLTIPLYMFENGLQLRAEPNENTARIWVKPCRVDNKRIGVYGVRLNADSNWSGTLDISQYAGSQLTLMLKFENSSGMTVGYSYVSFFVPTEPEEEGLG